MPPVRRNPFRSIAIMLALVSLPVTMATAAAANPGEPGHAGSSSWWPTDVGNRWSYVYNRERERVVGDVEETVETLRGTRVDVVASTSPQTAPGAVEIQSVLKGRSEGAVTDTIENSREVLSSSGAGIFVYVREAPHPLTGERRSVVFNPPFQSLRSGARSSEPWSTGVEQSGGLRTEYQSEILGIQDAQTPAGLFEKCLVLRTQGTVSGTVEIYGDQVSLDGGRLVQTEWFAPGVGRVLAKAELEHTLTMADGQTVAIRERSQFALSNVVLAGGQATGAVAEPVEPAAAMPAAPAPAPAPEADEPPSPPTPDPSGAPDSPADPVGAPASQTETPGEPTPAPASPATDAAP